MDEAAELQVGTGYAYITPPLGVELSGYGFFLARKATEIHRQLYARALVLEQEDVKAAILSVDMIALSAETVAQTRARVEAWTGIPRDNILIACTHTHSGPATLFLHGCGEPDPDYVALLPRYLATAVKEAHESLYPAYVYAGESVLDGLAMNRVDPLGKVDNRVQVVEFVEDNGSRSALFSFGCHPVHTLSEDTHVTNEFVGGAVEILESQPTNYVRYENALFLQGSCGDVNPTMAHKGPGRMRRASRMLAAATLLALTQSKKVDSVRPLRSLVRTIELPLAIPTREELERRRDDARALLAERDPDTREARVARFKAESAENLLAKLTGEVAPWQQKPQDAQTLPCELQAIQIGDIVLLAHPTELFAEFGLEIKAHSPFPHTFVVGYANDFLGYIPNEAEFERHGYAAETVPFMIGQYPYAPNVGRVFVEACVRLLNDLWEKR